MNLLANPEDHGDSYEKDFEDEEIVEGINN